MESLYHQTNKMILAFQNSLGRLEAARGPDVQGVEQDLNTQVNNIISNCERLDILVNKEPPTRRANAKLKVDQLKYDCQHLQSSYRNLQHKRYQIDEEAKQREALLTQRFTTNDSQTDGAGNTSIAMDHALQHHDSLQNSQRGVDELINSGSTIVGNLREQRATLKGAHRKILDLANTLGLSNTVMRLIERRTYQDKFILYGGMIVTCIIMFVIWKYLT